MSISKKEVGYCTEVDTLLGVLVTAVADVRSGKNAGQVFQDIEPKMVLALTQIGDLKLELADKKDTRMTAAMKVEELIDTLIG